MARTVFRPMEIESKADKVVLKFTKDFTPPKEEVVEEHVEYTGPTVEDLKKEADDFKVKWEVEKAKMIADAKAEADRIIKDAETAAFNQVKRQTDEATAVREKAKIDAEEIKKTASEEAEKVLSDARTQEKTIYDTAEKKASEEGREKGYAEGKAEADRLVERLHKMIDSLQERREEILDGTEQQIVNLVILIARKVVKVMSENQKSVIMSNVLEALKKVKGGGNITLRVNLADAALTTAHLKDFIDQVETLKSSQSEGSLSLNVVEDSSVDRGGCIVETDFGAIDARIQSQLNEIETQILNISPIKTVSDDAASVPEG